MDMKIKWIAILLYSFVLELDNTDIQSNYSKFVIGSLEYLNHEGAV